MVSRGLTFIETISDILYKSNTFIFKCEQICDAAVADKAVCDSSCINIGKLKVLIVRATGKIYDIIYMNERIDVVHNVKQGQNTTHEIKSYGDSTETICNFINTT